MKKAKTIAAFGLALASTVTFAGVKDAFATISPAANTKITITREITGVYTPVTNTFTYTISERTAGSCPNISSTLPFTTTIVFDGTESIDSNHKTSKSKDLDLSSLEFSGDLADCKLKITETGSTDTTSYPLSAAQKDFDLLTENELSNGVPTGTRKVTLSPVQDSVNTTDKTASFTGAGPSPTLTYVDLDKVVKGNFGDINQVFDFNVTVTRSNPGSATYDVIYLDAGNNTQGGTNCSFNTACQISIQHGWHAYIGVDSNNSNAALLYANVDTVSIVETGATDYTTVITDAHAPSNPINGKTISNRSVYSTAAENAITYTNTKTYNDVPTGRFFSALPFLTLGGVAGLGIALTIKKKATVKVQK